VHPLELLFANLPGLLGAVADALPFLPVGAIAAQ
jgi:hypothetical protein